MSDLKKNMIDENGADGNRSRLRASKCEAREADAILVRRREEGREEKIIGKRDEEIDT